MRGGGASVQHYGQACGNEVWHLSWCLAVEDLRGEELAQDVLGNVWCVTCTPAALGSLLMVGRPGRPRWQLVWLHIRPSACVRCSCARKGAGRLQGCLLSQRRAPT